MDHLTDDGVALLVSGLLDAPARADVDEHLANCAACFQLVASVARESLPAAARGQRPLDGGAQVGRYLLHRAIGAGGMGVVYAARDPDLDRPVAIKLLRGASGAQGRSRVLHEAQAMAKLSHPNVVSVYDVGTFQDQVFIAMELVEGPTLRQWLAARKRSWSEVLEIFAGAGRGLAAAHTAGLVHRDFKPDNVLIGKEGVARVTDFGLARVDESVVLPPGGAAPVESGPGALQPTRMTRTGGLVGSPAYMSPEQMSGKGVDARADQFSFCVALYEALYDVRPFAGETLPQLTDSLKSGAVAEPPPANEVPAWLHRVLLRGLSPSPAERFPSMEALLAVLERRLGWQRRRFIYAASLAALVALAIAAVALGRRGGQAQKPVVALIPLRNAAGPAAGWVPPIVDELLAASLAGDGPTLLPAATTVPAAAGAGLIGIDPANWDIDLVRRRVVAPDIVGGSVSLPADGQVRVELQVHTPRGPPQRFAEEGDQARIAELAARLGGDVRQRLGLPPLPSGSAEPVAVKASRLFAEGALLTRRFERLRAIEVLQQAAALQPDSPRIQIALALALLELRRNSPAREALNQALANARALPPDEEKRARVISLRLVKDFDGSVALACARWEERREDWQRGGDLLAEYRWAARYADELALVPTLLSQPLPAATLALVRENEADAAMRAPDFPRALAAAAAAREAAAQAGLRVGVARALYIEAIVRRSMGDMDRPLVLHAEAGRLFTEDGDEYGIAVNQTMLAQVYRERGEADRAVEALQKAVPAFHAMGEGGAGGELPALIGLGMLLREEGRLREAVEMTTRATTLAIEQKLPWFAATSLLVAGTLRLDLGDLHGAAASAQQALDLSKDNASRTMNALRLLGETRALEGNATELRAIAKRAHGIDPGTDQTESATLGVLDVRIAGADGRYGDAARLAAGLAVQLEKNGLLDDASLLLAEAAQSYWRAGQLGEARKAVDRARALPGKKRVLTSLELQIAEARVRATERPRELDDVLAGLRQTVDTASRLGVVASHWGARFAAAELELAAGRRGARAAVSALAQDARAQGFTLWAGEAESALKTRR
jgi:tetratricopeptide (TPR) repeat protein